jgi:hypothetical protein
MSGPMEPRNQSLQRVKKVLILLLKERKENKNIPRMKNGLGIFHNMSLMTLWVQLLPGLLLHLCKKLMRDLQKFKTSP